METLKKLTMEIEADLEGARFKNVGLQDLSTSTVKATAYIASTKAWRYVVTEFDIFEHGEPPATGKGYDGTASSRVHGAIMHLTRELAERVYTQIGRQYEPE